MLCIVFDVCSTKHTKPMASNNSANSRRARENRRDRKTSGRLKPSFTALQANTKSPHSAPVPDRSLKDVRKDPLTDYDELAYKTPKEHTFIRKRKSTRDAVASTLTELKYNYVVHVLRQVRYECDEDKQSHLEDLFLADPLGLEEIPKTDTNCWAVRRVGVAPVPTPGSTPAPATGTPSGTNSGTDSDS